MLAQPHPAHALLQPPPLYMLCLPNTQAIMHTHKARAFCQPNSFHSTFTMLCWQSLSSAAHCRHICMCRGTSAALYVCCKYACPGHEHMVQRCITSGSKSALAVLLVKQYIRQRSLHSLALSCSSCTAVQWQESPGNTQYHAGHTCCWAYWSGHIGN